MYIGISKAILNHVKDCKSLINKMCNEKTKKDKWNFYNYYLKFLLCC